MRNLLLALLLLASMSHSDSYVTEGGNVTDLSINSVNRTVYWAGITGWMNASAPFDPYYAVGYEPVGDSDINSTYANGTWYGSPMIVTRLAFRPDLSDIRSPTLADISTGGMFDNFTRFNGKDFANFADSPFFTFAGALTATCQLGSQAFSCAQITLAGPTPLWLLVFDDGTHEEPIFISNVTSTTGYNGSNFDFQYMVPVLDNYFFYIYPEAFGPNVTIITPGPITYDTNNIPFTYTITSGSGVDSCWYVLDGTRTDMPDCTISYILNVGKGTHILTLYANDTAGQVGSDSVRFSVTTKAPVTPEGGGGPGGPHIPQPEIPPTIPPAYDYFSVNPEDIRVTIDYPWAGESSFFLYSKYTMADMYCVVKGDFAQYSTVELVSGEISEGGTMDGRITVEIPPETLIDYKGGREGRLQCFGRSAVNSSLILYTSANVYLQINEPLISVENITAGLHPGQTINATIPLNNTGYGNASTYVLTAHFEGENARLVNITALPGMIGHWEGGELPIMVSAAQDFPSGTYEIPLLIYENGKLIGRGRLVLNVREGIYLPIGVCAFPAFLNAYVFYDSLPMWAFLIILAVANYALLNWRKRHAWQGRLLMAALPALLALPGIWIFAPCFMMNFSLLQFLLTFAWKIFEENKREEPHDGKKQRKKPRKNEGKADGEKGRKMAKEEK